MKGKKIRETKNNKNDSDKNILLFVCVLCKTEGVLVRAIKAIK